MLYIIANETSGSGAGTAALKRTCDLLREKGLPFRMDRTEAPGHATRLADAAVSAGESEIICLGGDGTISEVVRGLAGRFATLYFVPCGTGNDFVKVLNLPKDPIAALEAQLSGTPRKIDIGRLNETWFINVSGSGFDVEVLRQAARFKRLGKGLLPYLLGIFAALKSFRALPVEITLDGKTEKTEVTIVPVGNGCYIGGGMKAVPHAVPDDGLFDVVVAKRFSRQCRRRCREITFRCPGMVLDVDGELIPMDEAHYELIPAALEIRTPKEA